jgi:uncharacterized protein YdhG (YjbR/CyaY superfamily)
MAKVEFKNVDEYNKSFPKDVCERLENFRKIIYKIAPKATEKISYNIPLFEYKGKLVYYAAFKNHISFVYPLSDGMIKKFQKKIEKYKRSKSALQLPNDQSFPEKLIEEMLRFRLKENKVNFKIGKNKVKC